MAEAPPTPGTAKTQIGGSGFIAPKVWKAIAAPTIGNDSTEGCAAGDLWLDTTAVKAYVAFGVGVQAAVWKEITLAA